MTDVLIGLVVAGIAALAVRSVWKKHKAGQSCGCSGDCSKCGGCQ